MQAKATLKRRLESILPWDFQSQSLVDNPLSIKCKMHVINSAQNTDEIAHTCKSAKLTWIFQ